MRFVVAVLPVAVLLGACAGNPGTGSAGEDCPLTPADSVYLAGGAVYRDCAVDREASLDRRSVQLEMQSVNPERTIRCLVAEVDLVVGTDGRPEPGTWRLVRSTSPAFGDAVMRSVPGWQFQPAEKAGVPVRQVVRERQAVAVMVTAVRAGQTPPPPQTPPRC